MKWLKLNESKFINLEQVKEIYLRKTLSGKYYFWEFVYGDSYNNEGNYMFTLSSTFHSKKEALDWFNLNVRPHLEVVNDD